MSLSSEPLEGFATTVVLVPGTVVVVVVMIVAVVVPVRFEEAMLLAGAVGSLSTEVRPRTAPPADGARVLVGSSLEVGRGIGVIEIVGGRLSGLFELRLSTALEVCGALHTVTVSTARIVKMAVWWMVVVEAAGKTTPVTVNVTSRGMNRAVAAIGPAKMADMVMWRWCIVCLKR